MSKITLSDTAIALSSLEDEKIMLLDEATKLSDQIDSLIDDHFVKIKTMSEKHKEILLKLSAIEQTTIELLKNRIATGIY